MTEVTTQRHSCDEANAPKIAEWLRTRGGIVIWESVNLSNPGQTWTGPYRGPDGALATKPNWQCGETPARHITDPAEVDVVTAKEVKRFHVAVRRGSQGLSLKVSDGGSRRIRKEVDAAAEKSGKPAWYAFDYGEHDNCIIWVEDACVPLPEWLARQQPPPPSPTPAP